MEGPQGENKKPNGVLIEKVSNRKNEYKIDASKLAKFDMIVNRLMEKKPIGDKETRMKMLPRKQSRVINQSYRSTGLELVPVTNKKPRESKQKMEPKTVSSMSYSMTATAVQVVQTKDSIHCKYQRQEERQSCSITPNGRKIQSSFKSYTRIESRHKPYTTRSKKLQIN